MSMLNTKCQQELLEEVVPAPLVKEHMLAHNLHLSQHQRRLALKSRTHSEGAVTPHREDRRWRRRIKHNKKKNRELGKGLLVSSSKYLRPAVNYWPQLDKQHSEREPLLHRRARVLPRLKLSTQRHKKLSLIRRPNSSRRLCSKLTKMT